MSLAHMSLLARLGTWWHTFWFRPISAVGFGCMRVGFAVVALVTFALEWSRVGLFYTDAGLLPHAMIDQMLRTTWRFSLLDHASSLTVWLLYLTLLVALLLTALGLWTRIALLLSVILMYSFHEYALISLDGGDTLLRLLGFILLMSPCDRSMTLTNMWHRMERVRKTGTDQPEEERTLPIWPYRLLLWQMIILYIASSVEKCTGSTWRDGSAVAIALHHGHFTRLSPMVADSLAVFSPIVAWFTLLSQFAWILLLIVPIFVWLGVVQAGIQGHLRRALLLSGILIHGSILVMMDVGTFSFTVFVAYLGLLRTEDREKLRTYFRRRSSTKAIVLFDGRCGLCRRSVTVLKACDWLRRLELINFRDAASKKKYAANISEYDLDQEIHVKMVHRTEKGFYGFRSLCRILPPLWILYPILHIPGMAKIGVPVYAYIARNRPRCTDDRCTL